MDFLTATTTATSTIYRLTDNALDLINFFSQLGVFFGSVIVGLLVVVIGLELFK